MHLGNLFLKSVAEIGLALPEHTIEETTRWILTISAKTDDVGDLTIADDGNELTVDVGERYHRHFDADSAHGENAKQRRASAAKHAALYVNDVLNDLVTFYVVLDGDRILQATSSWKTGREAINSLLRTKKRKLIFRWSGLISENGG